MYQVIVSSNAHVIIQINLEAMKKRIAQLEKDGQKTDEIFINAPPFTRLNIKTGEQQRAFHIHSNCSLPQYPGKLKFANIDDLRKYLKSEVGMAKYGGRPSRTPIVSEEVSNAVIPDNPSQ